MSTMYGKQRVVLEKRGYVTICGSDSPSAIQPGKNAGSYFRLGYWYQDNGLYYVDLKSSEQLENFSSVTRETIGNRKFAGVPSKQSLRKFVMNYWNRKGVA